MCGSRESPPEVSPLVSWIPLKPASASLAALGPANVRACNVCGCTFNTKRTDGEEVVGSTILTPTATTMGKGHALLGFLFERQAYASLPIVSRSYLEIESHARLGQMDRTTGVGDMRVSEKYRFLKKGIDAAFLAGVKIPTGTTSFRSAPIRTSA